MFCFNIKVFLACLYCSGSGNYINHVNHINVDDNLKISVPDSIITSQV